MINNADNLTEQEDPSTILLWFNVCTVSLLSKPWEKNTKC